MSGRYEAVGAEAEFEPGSRNRVLRNRLGIRTVRLMDETESLALQIAQDWAVQRFGPEQRFTAENLCELTRVLALLMGYQAGLPPLDFGPLAGRNKPAYFAAIQAALGRDYAPLTSMFERVILRASPAGA